MSRDCPMIFRHQVEKRVGPKRANNGPTEAQMIICEQAGSSKRHDIQMEADLLAITRSKKRKLSLETSSKEEEEEMHDQWWKQDAIRKLAARVVQEEQETTNLNKRSNTKGTELQG